MGIVHAKPGEAISIAPLGLAFSQARTAALVKTDSLEVLRLIVPAGKEIASHRTRGAVTIQCLEGGSGKRRQWSHRSSLARSIAVLEQERIPRGTWDRRCIVAAHHRLGITTQYVRADGCTRSQK